MEQKIQNLPKLEEKQIKKHKNRKKNQPCQQK